MSPELPEWQRGSSIRLLNALNNLGITTAMEAKKAFIRGRIQSLHYVGRKTVEELRVLLGIPKPSVTSIAFSRLALAYDATEAVVLSAGEASTIYKALRNAGVDALNVDDAAAGNWGDTSWQTVAPETNKAR